MARDGIAPFDNTEIAFRGKSDKDLSRAQWLFRVLNSKLLTKFGMIFTAFALKTGLPVKKLIKSTVFRHFCGGESIKQCESTISKLAEGNVGSILDYSVEEGQDESVFRKTSEEIIRTIQRGEGDPRIPFTVFKVTGIGSVDLLEKLDSGKELTVKEQAEFFKLKARINHICRTAFDLGVRIMIDAEESWIQESIDGLALEMMSAFNREKAIVYNTWQMYRPGKLESLKEAIRQAEGLGFILGAKLVRGAYMEQERMRAALLEYKSPVYPDKASTDKDYNESLEFCVKAIKNVAFIAGTHNEYSCSLLTKLISKNKIPVSHQHVYFAQLLGMGDNISFNLAHSGYNVAKYVPYGPVKAVLPYLFRRAEENSAVTGKAGEELKLIRSEKKRRAGKMGNR